MANQELREVVLGINLRCVHSNLCNEVEYMLVQHTFQKHQNEANSSIRGVRGIAITQRMEAAHAVE